MKLKYLAEIKTQFPEADFWVVRRGSDGKVGKPTKKYLKYHFGVKVVRLDILHPRYLYYLLLHLFAEGYFRALAKGTTNLTHIVKEDLGGIDLEFDD